MATDTAVTGTATLPDRDASATTARRLALLVTFATVLLAAGLRLHNVSAKGFSLDEVWSVWMARQGVGEVVRGILLQVWDATPPVYYVLLHPFVVMGEVPMVVRLPSVLAGTAMVLVTFHLAAQLFGRRVATLSALLLALAPMHIAYSQTARAYVPAALSALTSLFFFARLVFRLPGRWSWLGLLIASGAALYTHYLTALVILFENAVILFLWLCSDLQPSVVKRWILGQAMLGAAVALMFASAFTVLTDAQPGRGLNWLPHPSIQSAIKSVILFGTGDPSFGPIGTTPERLLSLIVLLGILALGLWTFIDRYHRGRSSREGHRVMFLLGAIVVPWLAAFAISQVRPIYHEKYLLFLAPPLSILLAWVFVRARYAVVSALLLLALLGLIGRALFVYYTEPAGEQWREAIAYIQPAYQSGDVVILAPGFYVRPFSYYFYGSFPADTRVIGRATAVVLENERFRALSSHDIERLGAPDGPASTASRLWFVSGGSPIDPRVLNSVGHRFVPTDGRDFLGARVQLMQRMPATSPRADILRE